MPLNIIKKITDTLLGKPEQNKKTGAKQTKKSSERQKTGSKAPVRRGARTNTSGKDKPQANSGKTGTTARRPRKKSSESSASRSQRRASSKPGSPQDKSGTGKPGSRPPRSKNRNLPKRTHRRTQPSKRPTRENRPGGAVSMEESVRLQQAHANWSIDSFQVEPAPGQTRFHDFDLPSEVMHAIADLNFKYCTPIQALSLAQAMAGKNVAGKAQTGTGKTAAFLVAILTRYLRTPEQRQVLEGTPRALIIAPTRELVIQICKDALDIGKYSGLRLLAVYGGMDYDKQKQELTEAPVDLLVATPGRLLDFVKSRVIDLSKVDTLVIDEADRMLDMGFIPDVRSIIRRLPPKQQRSTMLYSATLDESVMKLAAQWMDTPELVEVESAKIATDSVSQIVYVIRSDEKFKVLFNFVYNNPDAKILVFCNRRSTTESVAASLMRNNIKCEVLSGDVNQGKRLRVLEAFRSGKTKVVVATDVAGRGLHVEDIGYVINYDFPYEAEDYVHRIGRTGRAGASGIAISFADEDESFIIPEIEKYLEEELKCTVLDVSDPLLQPVKPRKEEHSKRENSKVETPPPARDKQESLLKPQKSDRAKAKPEANTPSPPKPSPAAKQGVRPGKPRSRFSEEWVPGQ